MASVNSHTPMSGLADIERPVCHSASREGSITARDPIHAGGLPAGAASRGLIVQRWYTLEDSPEGAVHSVEEGALVRVHLRVATHQNRHYVAIEDPCRPAWSLYDVEDHRLCTPGKWSESSAHARRSPKRGHWASVFDRTERRDDHIRLFSDRLPIGVHHFSYLARARRRGLCPAASPCRRDVHEVSGRVEVAFYVHPAMEISQR